MIWPCGPSPNTALRIFSWACSASKTEPPRATVLGRLPMALRIALMAFRMLALGLLAALLHCASPASVRVCEALKLSESVASFAARYSRRRLRMAWTPSMVRMPRSIPGTRLASSSISMGSLPISPCVWTANSLPTCPSCTSW